MAASATARSTTAAQRSAARASAATRRASARPAPARRPPAKRSTGKQRRRSSTPVTGFVPVAAAATAGAVGGLADSGVVVRLTRSRLWIGLLGALLVGIVALNVLALSFSSSSSNAARQADELKRQNSALRAEIATQLSSEEVQAAASKLGLVFAEPGAIRYRRPSSDAAATAAKRLRAGELSTAEYAPLVQTAAVDPAATVPAEAAPVEAAPVEAAPAAEPAAVAPETSTPQAPAVPPAAPTETAPDAGGAVAP